MTGLWNWMARLLGKLNPMRETKSDKAVLELVALLKNEDNAIRKALEELGELAAEVGTVFPQRHILVNQEGLTLLRERFGCSGASLSPFATGFTGARISLVPWLHVPIWVVPKGAESVFSRGEG